MLRLPDREDRNWKIVLQGRRMKLNDTSTGIAAEGGSFRPRWPFARPREAPGRCPGVSVFELLGRHSQVAVAIVNLFEGADT